MQVTTPLPPPQPVLLLPTLRESTRDLHARIEGRLDITARLGSVSDYRTLLERFYGFYSPLEEGLAAPERVSAWADLGILSEGRRKAGLLESDLCALGLTAEDLDGVARCPMNLLPTPASTADLIGCAYVVEGATLGGQVIGGLLERSLGLRPGDPGARFFHGYGSQTGAFWHQFRGAAEQFAAREEAARPGSGAGVARQAVAASRRTFTDMEDWLMPEGVPIRGRQND